VTAREVLDGIKGRTPRNLSSLAWHETPEERDEAEAGVTADVARLTRAVEEALRWAEKFETNQSSDIAKRQDAQFDLGYSAGRRAAGNILRVAIENALNP